MGVMEVEAENFKILIEKEWKENNFVINKNNDVVVDVT